MRAVELNDVRRHDMGSRKERQRQRNSAAVLYFERVTRPYFHYSARGLSPTLDFNKLETSHTLATHLNLLALNRLMVCI